MPYIVKVKRGNKTFYGHRKYKTLAGIKKSIQSKTGRAFLRQNKLTGARPVKVRKMGRHF